MKTRTKIIILWGIWLLLNLIPINMYVFNGDATPTQETNIAIFWLMLSAAIYQGIYLVFLVIDVLLPIVITTILLRPKKK